MFTSEIEAYLSSARIPIRLACIDDDGEPLVLSLWYLYEDGKFYCATQASAKVAGYLRDRPACGFEIAGDAPPYCGVRGQGVAKIDPERGLEILAKLLQRYLGDTENAFARRLLARKTPEVAIVIEPTWLTSWNFANRMHSAAPAPPDKPCP